MILFQLGREYKLSVAEICNVFPGIKIIFVSKEALVVEGVTTEEVLKVAHTLGGSIKIAQFLEGDILKAAEEKEGKFKYGISVFGGKQNLKKTLITQKKFFKQEGISSRFVNKDFTNLTSSQILGERLVKKGTDFTLVNISGENCVFQTIWVQDIESYAKRDYGKSRDMQVGMLPPKLCQMMINMSGGKNIYDPFVGLGTVLIESVHMGNDEVYGSDLSEAMVETSEKNLKSLQKNIQNFDFQIEKLNAKFIEEFPSLDKVDSIVTEGYLGEMMTQKNISIDRIEKQKQSLEKIYEGFFSSLQKAKYTGTIVICFPFWEINKKFIYAENVYEILAKYTNISEIIEKNIIPEEYTDFLGHSKSGSLLYKRNSQLVGREIFKLTIK